jgi:probable phosphomutase (TIGR03848 family)
VAPSPRTSPPRVTRARAASRATTVRRRRTEPKSTLVLFVRHGLTPTTGKVLPGRAPGLHLSDKGRRQAERAAERIATLTPAPTAIYASPMERTRETAAPIARALGLRVRTNAGLLDCAVGEWEGKSLKTLAKKPEWRRVYTWPSGFRFPGGESLAEMQQRVLATVLSLVEAHPGERIVVVSHADPILLLLSSVAGVPLDMFQRLTISPASVSAVAFGALSPSVLCINSTGELAELAPA